MATESNNSSQRTASSPQPEEQSLSDRFAHACAITPLPKHQRANLPGATEEELRYLIQNDSGEIFMSPDAIWHNDDKSRPVIMSAMQKALRHACEGCDLELFPPDEDAEQLSESDNRKTTGDEHGEKKERDKKNAEDESDEGDDEEAELGQRPSFCSLLGIPDFKPISELRTLTWASSEAKKVIDAFNDETDRIRAQRAAKEAAEEAALFAKMPAPAKKPAPPKPPITDDPVLWAAQEEAAAASVMRDMRARSKKSLWGSKSTKLKPEAAAEMARARVAAAAAAAVMRNEDRGAELVRAETVDSGDFFERFAKGKRDGGFYPMHAQAFQRAMSLDSDPEGKKKKKVAFAADTVFSRNK